MFNSSASAKVRAALGIVLDAEDRGLLKPGAIIVEPIKTSLIMWWGGWWPKGS